MHGFMSLEEVDLIIFDECHHTDQDHPYNLIMRDFWFHNFDPLNPLKVKKPKIVGLTASPIKQKIERNKVQAIEIEHMLQNLSNNLYARFVSLAPSEISSLEKDLEIDIQTYKTNFEQNLEAVTMIEKSLLNKIAELISFPADCYKMTDYSCATAPTQPSSRLLDQSQLLDSSRESLLTYIRSEVQDSFREEQDNQVLKFLNGHKKMIELDVSFTKEKLAINSFTSYEDKVLLIFCIIMVKNINNLLLEVGPLAVKAFFMDLKKDLLQSRASSRKQESSKNLGLKSDVAIQIIDSFCNPSGILDSITEPSNNGENDLINTGEPMNQEIGDLDRNSFQVSDKVRQLIKMLNKSYDANHNVKTIIFVKDRSVAVYLKKLLAGEEQSRDSDSSENQRKNTFLSQGLLDKDKFRIGFAMGFKTKNIVNLAYKALNTEKISMYQDVLGQLPSVRSIKLSQNQLIQTLEKFRKGQLNVIIATNVVEEGLDVSTCNQVICLNELLTVKAFIQMKGRARQENSKFVFVCAQEQRETFEQSKAMFGRVINFMKKITTKAQREVVPEKHVLDLRRQNQEQFYEVESTKAKITAKQAKVLIEKFCTDFCEKTQFVLSKKMKEALELESQTTSQRAQNLSSSDGSSIANQTLTSEQIQAQIDGKLNQGDSLTDSSAQSEYQMADDKSIANMSQVQLSSSDASTPADNHKEFKPNYVARESCIDGVKFFFCILYFPRRCKDIVLRKQNPDKAFVKKRDAENHVALLAVKRLQQKGFLTENLMTNYSNPKIKELLPPSPPASSQGPPRKFFSEKSQNTQNRESGGQSNKNKSEASQNTSTAQRRTKMISEEEKQEERSKHKRFEQHKKTVTFKAPENQINNKVYERPLNKLLVYVFKGVDKESEYPFRNTKDFLGILFNRKFTNPSMQFLMYQEQRQKQKNKEHLSNLVRKGLLEQENSTRIEQGEECLSIALTRDDCFEVELPLLTKPDSMSFYERQNLMAAKLQCYHTWLFYYLYSADHKFIKAIFKLKFEFVKVLFGEDFSVLFKTYPGQTEKVQRRKDNAFEMLRKIYFPQEQQQYKYQSSQSNQQQQQSYYGHHRNGNRNNSYGYYHRGDNRQSNNKRDYLGEFEQYIESDLHQQAENQEVKLRAYSIPVTNQQMKKSADESASTANGLGQMRVDWTTIDKVIEWVRSRLYELCLPTERTLILFRYTIDDPIRSFKPRQMQNFNEFAKSLSQEDGKNVGNDLAERERSHLTGKLWDQRFQGNRFVILNQELIHYSQDKPIDLNQSKKEFSVRRDELYASLVDFYQKMFERSQHINKKSSSSINMNNSHRQVSMNPKAQEFHLSETKAMVQNASINQLNMTAANMSMVSSAAQSVTTIGSGQGQITTGEQTGQFKTREFYFLKQGIFEHRIFSKYIVKCRKERHFLDFGKKKRDEVLLEEQLAQNNGILTSAMSRRVMPHGANVKTFNQLQNRSHWKLQQQQEQAKKRTNTEFDILDQMLTLAPISYNQYQVLQTTCYHMLNFNELLMTEKFINEVFEENLMCILEASDDPNDDDLKPADASKDILHTYDQLIKSRGDEEKVKSKSVREQLLQKIAIVKEALTSPGACREYDYERLEFYGDSIIGFLVILELFVTKPTMVEGDLDFKRIQKVSNMRFYEVNKQNNFHDFMITESHQVFSGYDHAGFDSQCTCLPIRQNKNFCICKRSSCKITQKHHNELKNKLAQLKMIKTRLEEFDYDVKNDISLDQSFMDPEATEQMDLDRDPLKQIFMRGNLYQLAEMIRKGLEKELKTYDQSGQEISLYQQQNSRQKSRATETEKTLAMCKKIMCIPGGPNQCLLNNIEKVISKVESQITNNSKKPNERNKRQKGPFYYKQLADVVESVTGAVTLACGLNCTQDYLRSIKVLEFDQAHLMTEMEKLVKRQKEKSVQLDQEFYVARSMIKVEEILDYSFNCKAWLIEALTHKSFSREHEKTNEFLEDYERLEFLGDAVLGYLMARYFFKSTQKDDIRKNPKELHKMKTSVINNNLLSLIVIENEIHKYMIYNTKAPSFYEQFQKYVKTVHEMSAAQGSTKELVEQKKKIEAAKASNKDGSGAQLQPLQEFDLDTLHEHNLKIFGDVFESLIGAVFLDSQSVKTTWKVLKHLIEPYVYIYADLSTLQDHSRTLLLEMWNQKIYTKNLTCKHNTEELESGEKSRLNGIIVDNRNRDEIIVYSETFTKDAKSKVRTFYKHFYQLVKKFVDEVDLLPEDKQRDYSLRPEKVIQELKFLWEKEKADKEDAENKLKMQEQKQSLQSIQEDEKESKNEFVGDFEDKDVAQRPNAEEGKKPGDTPGIMLQQNTAEQEESKERKD